MLMIFDDHETLLVVIHLFRISCFIFIECRTLNISARVTGCTPPLIPAAKWLILGKLCSIIIMIFCVTFRRLPTLSRENIY